MENFFVFIKQTPKNIFFIFVAILLIFAMCISCTTTSDEGINDNNVTEEADNKAVIEDLVEGQEPEEDHEDVT